MFTQNKLIQLVSLDVNTFYSLHNTQVDLGHFHFVKLSLKGKMLGDPGVHLSIYLTLVNRLHLYCIFLAYNIWPFKALTFHTLTAKQQPTCQEQLGLTVLLRDTSTGDNTHTSPVCLKPPFHCTTNIRLFVT